MLGSAPIAPYYIIDTARIQPAGRFPRGNGRLCFPPGGIGRTGCFYRRPATVRLGRRYSILFIRYKRCFIKVYNPKRGQGVPPLWGAASGGRAEGKGVPMRARSLKAVYAVRLHRVSMKYSRRPGCVRRSTARACGSAFVRPCMPYAVAALPRGGAGLRNEKTFSPFAEAFGDCAKSFCGRLRLPGAARAFSQSEARRIRGSPFRRTGGERTAVGGGPLCVRSGLRRRRLRVCGYWVRNADSRCCLRGMLFRRAGAERCVRRARRCGRIAKRTARSCRAAFAAGRSAAFALALGGFAYWPESTSASRQPLSAADAESRQKEIFRPCGGRCGTAAGG